MTDLAVTTAGTAVAGESSAGESSAGGPSAHAAAFLGGGSRRGLFILNYLSVYIGWGTSYYVVGECVHALPPSLLLAARYALAAAVLGALALLRGRRRATRPTAREALNAAFIGFTALGVSIDVLAYAQRTVPSGIAAIIVGCTPAGYAFFDYLLNGVAMTRAQLAGAVTGSAGVALLALSGDALAPDGSSPMHAVALVVVGLLLWCFFSIFSKRLRMPGDALTNSAIQSCAAAVGLGVLGPLALGETLSPASLSPRAVGCVVYLALIPSCVTYTSYLWLMKNDKASRLATYTFVNPIVAVLIGVALAGETIDRFVCAALLLTALGTFLSLGGVALLCRLAERMGGPFREAPQLNAREQKEQPGAPN